MLAEIHVTNLGVIADLTLVFDAGMTVITGETGAGKTLVVDAIELLVGERADSVLVGPGGGEATVEGRFFLEGDEVVLRRVVPATGRSRAYVDGRLATVAELAQLGERLVDLHGQHSHQSLLSVAAQRAALDRFGGVELGPLLRARARRAAVARAMDELGGDARSRARELDLLRYELHELEAAGIRDPDEDEKLEAEEDALADAASHREAGEAAHAAVLGDGGAIDSVARARHACRDRAPFTAIGRRLAALEAELSDLSADLRAVSEAIAENPQRLDDVRSRRRLLSELRRKYGDRLADVMEYERQARTRLAELQSHDRRVAELESEGAEAEAEIAAAAAQVRRARTVAAARLAAALQERLRTLAMPDATVEVAVDGDGPGDDVRILLAANRGGPPLPLTKVASGGELSRTMLAARLVLAGAPPVLVFDEVDAGIGGQAALAVGQALSDLAVDRQVLVVTHLPQVAAFADTQISVSKHTDQGRTLARASVLNGEERLVELSRMLSGQPASGTARDHASELLRGAARQRRRATAAITDGGG